MTENKRFMLDDCGELIDLNNHTFVDYGDGVCNLLNELNDENGQLKIDNRLLYSRNTDLKRKNELYDAENEQLKADNNRLVNETARIVAEHQRKVLDLIDKSLEKDKQYYEMSYEDYLNGRIEALEQLKKELLDD